MKTLVTFYSRTGNTKTVGEQIAKNLNADVDSIIDKKDRSGIIGWLGGGRDTLFKKPTKIENKIDPSEYDLVIIGTPIWVGTKTPAVKEYISTYKFKKVAFFCTAGSKQTKAFKEMEELTSKPLATLDIKDKEVPKAGDRIKEFCDKLR